MKVIAVSRDSIYSPNSTEKDKRILLEVEQELSKKGHEVSIYTEAGFVKEKPQGDVIFTMARNPKTLQLLDEYAEKGCLIVNSPQGVRNCIRKPMTSILQSIGLPLPKSMILDLTQSVSSSEPDDWNYPCWIKRADACAQKREDVSYAENAIQRNMILDSFVKRGIQSAVASVHVPGDIVKFYGVAHTDFFSWHHPQINNSKFGLERINGEVKGFQFDADEMKKMADRAACALDAPVYGGDCIVTSDGNFKLIDFNDWPSFSCCREEAGCAIVECICKLYEQR